MITRAFSLQLTAFKVTGSTSAIFNDVASLNEKDSSHVLSKNMLIVVGSLDNSRFIRELVDIVHGEPSVQCRGIFINDETPGLTDWTHEKFGPKLNSEFYKRVFELLLRMNANFLWPAMWSGFPEPGNIFFEDDPLNQEIANSILTLGMRGESDGEIQSKDSRVILTDVITTQRNIVNDVYGRPYGRRNTTNDLAHRILRLFDDDWLLTEQYHHSPWVGDKWNHIMKQPHYGLEPTTWQAPSRDMITGLSFVQRRQASNSLCGQTGIAVEGHSGARPGLVNEESDRMQPSRRELVLDLTLPTLCRYGPESRFLEIYTRGASDVDCFTDIEQDWVVLSQYSGHLSPDGQEDQRVEVSIDSNKAPMKLQDDIISIRSQQGDFEEVHVKIFPRKVPDAFGGFVESIGSISIDVGMSLSRSQEVYQTNPYLGRTSSGTIGLIQLSKSPGIDWQPLLYPIYLFSSTSTIRVILHFTMTLGYQREEQLRYKIARGDSKQTVRLLEYHSVADLPVGWDDAVRDNVWTRTHSFHAVCPGAHVIGYRPLSRGLFHERIIVDV
ncbi:hypothetical protein N7520_008877 [Penicillium odoratum]|uniref:uncharacterized protein n=1 Tax=Penicillium odoratum TaxID=1167516 RepID=UPI0025492E6F|nr:uncharacterized protein N7520_008877 [Penicillium odoratum]KAJ5751960.1 hypothetical protein N7520_008877 [Penicillium odoratum]